MLSITAHGNLGRDPELATDKTGQEYAKFSLAATTGKEETTWLSCTVWGKRAQTFMRYCTKGSKITIIGKGKLRTYTNKEGVEKSTLDVSVTDFTLPARQTPIDNPYTPGQDLAPKNVSDNAETPAPYNYADIPF